MARSGGDPGPSSDVRDLDNMISDPDMCHRGLMSHGTEGSWEHAGCLSGPLCLPDHNMSLSGIKNCHCPGKSSDNFLEFW